MEIKGLHRKIGLGVLLLSTVILTACGRDTSTVESSLNGQWELAEATVNGQPLEEVVNNLDETFGSGSDAESAAGNLSLDSTFYFNEGELTVVGADNQQNSYAFEVVDTNEENDSITLEMPVSNEEVDFTLNGSGTFTDEERESLDFTLSMADISMPNPSNGQQSSAEQIGQEFAIRIFENINVETALNYVDDTTTPE